MFAWMVWIGVNFFWALFMVGFGFMVALLITRIVAETGMPFVRIDASPMNLVRLAPIPLVGPVAVWAAYVIGMIFPIGSRVNPSAMAIHAFGLDSSANPRKRLAVILVVILLAGLAISGGAHLFNSYHNSATLDGLKQPLCEWGYRQPNYAATSMQQLKDANNAIAAGKEGNWPKPPYSQVKHLLFGGALAGVLQWACIAIPRWPLHPIGLVMISTYYSNEAWISVLIGWLIKILLIRYGGARLYRGARSFFLGLIIGEVFAAVLWCLIPAILALLGMAYQTVLLLPT
jgi:hypothetical protein